MSTETTGLLEAMGDACREVCQKLADAGHGVHLVGGAVRDTLLGTRPADFDVATSARPEQVLALFEHSIPTGLRHGTVTVVGRAGEHVEVTTYRLEKGYSDGRHPDQVRFVRSIEEDLGRRDFTINAIAVAYPDGALVDPFDGQGDLRRRQIRCVGDSIQRFSEDGLRLLRAARFMAQLDMEIEPGTRGAMAVCREKLGAVSAERIRDELLRLLGSPSPAAALRVLAETGVLQLMLPEMSACMEHPQNKWHAHDVFEHILAVVDAVPAGSPDLRVAALLHDIGKPDCAEEKEDAQGEYRFHDHERRSAEIAEGVLRRLRFSGERRERVLRLIDNHMWHYTPDWTDGAVRRWLARIGGLDELEDNLALRRADILGRGIEGLEQAFAAADELALRARALSEQQSLLSVKDLAIDGHQVMQLLGLKPGPEIGKKLNFLLEKVQEKPELNTYELLAEMLRK